MGGQVVGFEQSPAALDVRRQGLGDRAPVEGVGSVGGDGFKSFGQGRQSQGLVGPGQGPLQGLAQRRVSLQVWDYPLGRSAQFARQYHSGPGLLGGRSEQISHGQGAVAGVGPADGVDEARHGHRDGAESGDLRTRLNRGFEPGRSGTAAVDGSRPARRLAHQHEGVAADPAPRELNHALHRGRGHCRVYRAAAPVEHLNGDGDRGLTARRCRSTRTHRRELPGATPVPLAGAKFSQQRAGAACWREVLPTTRRCRLLARSFSNNAPALLTEVLSGVTRGRLRLRSPPASRGS